MECNNNKGSNSSLISTLKVDESPWARPSESLSA